MSPSPYCRITEAEANSYLGFERCSHVLLYAKTDKPSIIHTPRKATVLMQMRFDGCLGFPGGLVDEGETPVEGVNRECLEEISWPGTLTPDDLLFVHVRKDYKLICYFFGKELSEDELTQVIRNSTESRDFGYESLGMVIVPLHTMDDSFRGLPAFLKHRYIGNARTQLTEGLIDLNILSKEEISTALNAKDPNNV